MASLTAREGADRLSDALRLLDESTDLRPEVVAGLEARVLELRLEINAWRNMVLLRGSSLKFSSCDIP